LSIKKINSKTNFFRGNSPCSAYTADKDVRIRILE